MTFLDFISLVSDIVEISIGVAALIITISQRDKISAAFSILFNYSFQTSISDFKSWIHKLQDSPVEEATNSKKARVALATIEGKIRGNKTLLSHYGSKVLKRITIMIVRLDNNEGVTETEKHSLCSELIESVSELEVDSYKNKI